MDQVARQRLAAEPSPFTALDAIDQSDLGDNRTV